MMHFPKMSVWRLLGLLTLCLWGMMQPAAAHLLVIYPARTAQALQETSHYMKLVGQIDGESSAAVAHGNCTNLGVGLRWIIRKMACLPFQRMVEKITIMRHPVQGAIENGCSVCSSDTSPIVISQNNGLLHRNSANVAASDYEDLAVIAVKTAHKVIATDILDNDAYRLTILHTNDFHGHVDEYQSSGAFCFTPNDPSCIAGSPRIATLVDQIRTVNENVLVLDAGDQFQDTLFYDLYKSEVIAEMMNAIGYDAMAVGNHEFDDGPDELVRLIDAVEFPVVAANIDVSAEVSLTGKLPAYTIVERSGEEIAIVGLTTPETESISSPGPNIEFLDPIETLRATVYDLTSTHSIDKIIVLAHQGYDADQLMAAAVSGVDVIIGGHSHTFLYTGTPPTSLTPAGSYPTVVQSPAGEPVLVVTAYQWGTYLGHLDVTFDPNGVITDYAGNPIYVANSVPKKVEVETLLEPYRAGVAGLIATEVGTITVAAPINVGGARICRLGECLMGNLVADAMLWKVTQAEPAGGYQIALTNGGGLRAPLITGTVTMGDVMEVLPFGNALATMGLTGADLLAALEYSARLYPSENSGFLQVSGMKYTFDPVQAVGSRITDAQVWNGTAYEPVVPTTIYKVVMSNFTRKGGDGYTMFRDNAINPYDFGPDLALLLAEYFQMHSPVTLEIEGRIINAQSPTPVIFKVVNTDGDGSYTVSWSNISNAIGYTLQEATNSNFTGATTAYSGSGTSTNISSKSQGTFYYRVHASSASGDSAWSNTQSVVVIALPTAPTLNAIANADGDGSYAVRWSPVSVATGYTLQEATNSSFTGATTAYSGSGTSTSITGKAPGTYYYRVRSSNIRGDSTWSNIQSVVVVAPPTTPTLNAIANADGDANYTVSWGSVSGATGYTLQEATNSTFTGATTAYSGSGTSTAISGKAPSTYYYRVRASNAGGDSAWSNTQAVVVVAPPGAPTLNSIGNADGDGNYSISWGFVDGATTYTLQEATSSSFADAATIYANGGTFTSVSNRTLGTYYYRVQATNVVGNSSWSNTRSVIVSVETGDAYEPDDTCIQAHSISIDGIVQECTFHKQADEDWVVFSATAGVTYRIEAQVPLESPANVAVEVYDQCAGVPVDEQNYAFAAGVRLEFTAPTTGLFYLKWANHDPDIFGANVAYEISMRALATEAQPGAVVIVAGRYKYNDPLQPNIHYAASQIYQMFQNNGYPADRIYYLSTDLTQPGANALATVSHLQTTISTWTLDKVDADRPLTLYLVDHGMPNQIYLDRPKGEAVTPTQLDTWLTQLETARPGLKVNIIMEACYSGSFIGLPQSLSKIGRVVVASTSATDLAYASVRGAVFSDYFSAALTQGASVYGAFESARGATRSGYPYQNPWLDANGNSIPNEAADAQIAALRGFAYAGTLSGDQWPPYIAQTTPVAVAGGKGNLRVEVRDDNAVRYVWAVIYPPSYTPPATQEELVQETLPTAMLLSQGNGWYGAQYTGFNEMGEYRVVFYAEDDLGLSAQPVAIMVQTGWAMYLPMVIKQ